VEDSVIIPKERILYLGRNFNYENRVLKVELMRAEGRSFVSVRDDKGAELTTWTLADVSEEEQRKQYEKHFADVRGKCSLEIDDNGLVSRLIAL
jgi:hypothetical protein